MSRLFTPWQLGELELPNRIVVAPMCQYSADDGTPGDWHLLHLGTLALSGAGLLMLEATAVSREGRISARDLGLYRNPNESALKKILGFVREQSDIAIGIQLSHAGRKGSSQVPWEGGKQIGSEDSDGWKTEAPSPIPHAEGEDPPLELDEEGLERVREDFVESARRAMRLALDGIEIHMAHGYLLHQFLSPLANQRGDDYGGSLENRMRFPLEVFDAVRATFSPKRPVWARISATDWVEGGWDVDSAVVLAKALKARGCAAIHVSSGGVSTAQKIELAPGYQVAFAERIRAEAQIQTIAVGLITEPEQAEAIIEAGQADAVALARGMLWNPRWPWLAAARLGGQVVAPKPYWRSQPRGHEGLFTGAQNKQR
ncbi:MAG: NADH:flavin oxidoreductase/NADH oxidase [Rubrivivax sp.]